MVLTTGDGVLMEHRRHLLVMRAEKRATTADFRRQSPENRMTQNKPVC